MAEYIYNKWASSINLYMPDTLTFTSVHNIPGAHASAAFTSKTSEVFKEEHNIAPIIINDDASRIVRIVRKQACYVRFAPADKSGVIPYILYANWRNTVSPEDIERIELLNPQSPLTDLHTRSKKIKKFAVVSRIPTPDNTYYPIPYYAARFKGKWYHIEIANSFWNNIFKVEGITDRVKQLERVNEEKDAKQVSLHKDKDNEQSDK